MKENLYNKLSKKVNTDYKTFLIQKYVDEMLPTSKISILVYGNSNNKTSIVTHLKELGIELRHGSSAIKTQWINNDERRNKQSNLAKNKLAVGESRNKLIQVMQSDEYKEKQRQSKIGNKNGMYGIRGKEHPNWNENLTDDERKHTRKTFEDCNWRKQVLIKDNYTCKKCGCKDINLNAHHILNFHNHKDLRYNVDNGITLCENCHIAFHKLYGYKNNNDIQINEYLQSKQPDNF